MTFVRAQIIGGTPHVLADWCVTRDASRRLPSYQDGVLKILLLSPTVWIAYAGDVDEAIAAIKAEQGNLVSGTYLADALVAASRAGRCEFLIGTFSSGLILQIKRGRTDTTTSGWLGDQRALEVFQEVALPLADTGLDEGAVLRTAFDAVIEQGTVAGVGITTVAVLPEVAEFIYAPSMRVTPGFTPQLIPSGVPTPISFGSASDGGFAESVMGAASDAAVGIYFHHGGFGVVSAPLVDVATRTIRASTQSDFVAAANAQLGIQLVPGLELS